MYRIFDTEIKEESGIVRLSWNDLTNINTNEKRAEFIRRVSTITPGALHLDLSGNHLGLVDIDFLKDLAHEIKQPILSLNLSFNNLDQLETKQLIEFFSLLPTSLQRVNLSHNKMGKKPMDEMISLLNTLPNAITEINFTRNFLTQYAIENLGKSTGRTIITMINEFEEIHSNRDNHSPSL